MENEGKQHNRLSWNSSLIQLSLGIKDNISVVNPAWVWFHFSLLSRSASLLLFTWCMVVAMVTVALLQHSSGWTLRPLFKTRAVNWDLGSKTQYTCSEHNICFWTVNIVQQRRTNLGDRLNKSLFWSCWRRDRSILESFIWAVSPSVTLRQNNQRSKESGTTSPPSKVHG